MTPFMENKQLFWALSSVGLFSLALASNFFPWVIPTIKKSSSLNPLDFGILLNHTFSRGIQ